MIKKFIFYDEIIGKPCLNSILIHRSYSNMKLKDLSEKKLSKTKSKRPIFSKNNFGSYFENLVVNTNKITNETNTYILKYNLLSTITHTTHDAISFDSHIEITPITYNNATSQASRGNSICYTYYYDMCDNGDSGHVRGPG